MKLLFIQTFNKQTLFIHAMWCVFLAHLHFFFFRALSNAQEATSACLHSVTM